MAIIYVNNNKNNGYYLEYLLHIRHDPKYLNRLIHLIFSTYEVGYRYYLPFTDETTKA